MNFKQFNKKWKKPKVDISKFACKKNDNKSITEFINVQPSNDNIDHERRYKCT